MTSPTRTCRVCYQPMKGHSREVCQLQYQYSRQYMNREEDLKSEVSDYSSATTTSGWSRYTVHSYMSPPVTPRQSPSGRSTVSTNASTTVSEKQVLRLLAPPPPKYPISILSDASYTIPETGPFHRVNPRFRAVSEPPRLARESSLAPSEPAHSVYSSVNEGSLASVNLRGASPGPSAYEYMQTYRGPLGPSISESGRSNVTARPVANHDQETVRQGSTVHLGGDRSINPFCGVSVAPAPYNYWPGNQITPPPSPRHIRIPGVTEDAIPQIENLYLTFFEMMRNLPSQVVSMFQAMARSMRDNKPVLANQVLITFLAVYIIKIFL